MKSKEKELQDLLDGIYNIFKLVKCDQAPLLELLGTLMILSKFIFTHTLIYYSDSNAKISDCNAMVYLGLIEKQVSSLVTQAYFNEKHVR